MCCYLSLSHDLSLAANCVRYIVTYNNNTKLTNPVDGTDITSDPSQRKNHDLINTSDVPDVQ